MFAMYPESKHPSKARYRATTCTNIRGVPSLFRHMERSLKNPQNNNNSTTMFDL